MQQIASQNAPHPRVVLPHFVFGGLVWLTGAALVVAHPDMLIGHYFNPKLLALTHLLVLGWITMVIFGALYQMAPVVMEVKLYSERLSVGTFALLATGTLFLTIAFWRFELGAIVLLAAALLALAVLLFFAFNIFMTARASDKSGLEQDFILTSVVWLLFTVAAGITLAFNLRYAFLDTPHVSLLHLHAHAGLAGWLLQLIIGVSSRILPMFTVSHGMNRKKLSWAYTLINGGLAGGILALYAQWPAAVWLSAAVGVAGIACYLSYILETYRKRSKMQLDIGMRQTALSFILFPIPLVLALIMPGIALPMQLAIAYGAVIVLGFISSLIMGQTYKTLPFIVWLHAYRPKVGREKVPMPKDLYRETVALWQLRLYAASFAGVMAGVVLQSAPVISIGGAVLSASVALYNFNIWLMVRHRPGNNNASTHAC